MNQPFPVIDLFAGPGGLAEGFAAALDESASPYFRIGLSIEKDQAAHQTLQLRALFRLLSQAGGTDIYFDYVRGDLPAELFFSDRQVANLMRDAGNEARLAELGKTDPAVIDGWIHRALESRTEWVLVGGPPCQAYSLVGRSRRRNDAAFEEDEKHLLYREYLRILKNHGPPVFVMENVKGLLTSLHGGTSIFSRILQDLSRPGGGLEYEIRSFAKADDGLGFSANEFVIQSELFGIPQRRHRVILLGVRKDRITASQPVLQSTAAATVRQVIGRMPRIRSRLTRGEDSPPAWREAAESAISIAGKWKHEQQHHILRAMVAATVGSGIPRTSGSQFMRCAAGVQGTARDLAAWLQDNRIGGVLQHEARGHMRADLQRYLFAACFAKALKASPRLSDFPKPLLPHHQNANDHDAPFEDRFRVQLEDSPATTIMSHIAKDGHYYIHPDPSQCRSLTVREAARLQTFPDNYFFEGNRTQQYSQVGNAVPPHLARQLAKVVASLLTEHGQAGRQTERRKMEAREAGAVLGENA